MTTQDMFLIIRLLSAMESAMYTAKVPMPEHLGTWIDKAIADLENAIVNSKEENLYDLAVSADNGGQP